jgi:hypothetical protein
MPSEKIRIQHGSAHPVGLQVNKDRMTFISLNEAIELRDDLNWAIERINEYEKNDGK